MLRPDGSLRVTYRNIPKAKQREAWVKTEPSIKEKEFTPTRLYVPKGLKSICDL